MAKILIVEDDANLRMLMTMRLKSKYAVAAAADGREEPRLKYLKTAE